MEYQVPQFIEVEDKIVGPLTLRQFIYLGGGAGLCVVLFLKLPLILAVLLGAPVAGLAGALAFYKVNGKSFTDVLEAAAGFYTSGRLFLWKHDNTAPAEIPATPLEAARAKAAQEAHTALPRLSQSKLRDLAWSLDVKDQQQNNPPQ
jgi:hypothetical protein